ncbi:hypothetical protein [Phreatobacter oligotrophus]|uniref:hypothetical protein n=1 Tax=Phreatobacter oligotrophus TaxID=1122261 RepID=UPI00235438ED|nr:hypothetical protein [Phreatobacter oligotrophus]MBX9991290.1 hypothetical protein [Phreatobacter oligotrophus]
MAAVMVMDARAMMMVNSGPRMVVVHARLDVVVMDARLDVMMVPRPMMMVLHFYGRIGGVIRNCR